jgi:hypothetical protein
MLRPLGTFSGTIIPDGSNIEQALQSLEIISSSVEKKTRDEVSVVEYDAVGDGTTDDTTAIQNALNSGLTNIRFPKGIYRVTANLTRSGNTYIHGDGPTSSKIIFEGTAGFVYTGNNAGSEYDTHHLHVERMGFITSGISSKTVFSAIWTDGIGGTSSTFVMRDCQITGASTTSSFGKALYLQNARNAKLDNIRILGDRDGAPITSTTGIEINGTNAGAPVEVFFNAVRVFYCIKAYEISGWVEGINFDAVVAVNCRRGIYAAADTTTPRPWVRISGCHFNTDTTAIELTNFVQYTITNNLLYATNFDTASTAYNAIVVDGANASADSHIKDNTLQCILTGVPTNGIVVLPGDTASDDNITISGNSIVGYDTGIYLQPNTKNVRVADDNDIRYCTTMINNQGNNLICVAILSDTNGSKKYLDGLVEKWGSSVVTLDVNGDGSITFTEPFGSVLVPYVNNGDTSALGDAVFSVKAASTTTLSFSVRPNPGSVIVRANWSVKGTI